MNIEKLGAFYLGRRFDADAGAVTDEPYLYDAKDLTTHAVCLGMTGSGKTGLCVTLLEEAAIDGVPVLAIDPKGDLGNLALAFPKLRADDFAPWIDPGEAARAGRSPQEHAAHEAERWRAGIADWGQSGERIDLYHAGAEFAIYTPGSSAGRPIAVLRALTAPPQAVRDDADALRERVGAVASGLLTLLGIDADPARSREHILLATILQGAWRHGQDLDLGALIRHTQSPTFQKVGFLDLESFYPQRDRFELAMAINNLAASPTFATWTEGEPLDVGALLRTPNGRPRVSVLSIAHLSDSERMFFVSAVLNEVVAWVRAQPGTGSLRALLYLDEVFGYLPPSAEPPSKRPLLTLLKQARASGLGVVLATQNPVDLDYKALSNAGTWFLGRLQTERDRDRVLDGLRGAGADTDRLAPRLAGLKKRVFLVHNVHEDAPTLIHSRWALSYLRGPLTRPQIEALSARDVAAAPATPAPPQATAPATAAAATRPVIPPEIDQCAVAVEGSADDVHYRPALLGQARLHYVDRRGDLDEWRPVTLMATLAGEVSRSPWNEAEPVTGLAFTSEPVAGARFAEPPAEAMRAKSYASWTRALQSHLYRDQALTLWNCPALGERSRPDEDERAFRARLSQLAREHRDRELAKLEARYAPQLKRVQERIARAEERVGRERDQHGHQKMQTAISVGATLLGAMLGRKKVSLSTVGRATTAMRGASRVAREADDIERAREKLAEQQERFEELEAEFQDAVDELRARAAGEPFELEEVPVRPRKSDITIERVAFVWVPS